MPRKTNAGTWEGSPVFRWTRMVHGIRWRLLCRNGIFDPNKPHIGYLNLPRSLWTKEGSRESANAWWDSNLIATQVRDPELHAALKATLQSVQAAVDRTGFPVDSEVTEAITDQLRITRPASSANKLMLEYWKKEYLALKREDGQRGAGRFDNLQRSITRFVEEIGPSSTVNAITEEKYRRFCHALLKAELSGAYKRDTISDVRGFLRFLWEERLIPELRNLLSIKARVVDSEVQHFTADELRAMLTTATGPLRLFVWLFTNCGMRQRDVATITPAMFDGKYITRKRSKTQDHANAPKVSHVLWPETLALVNEHRSQGGELLFLQPNGKPWVTDAELNENGRRCRDDNFAELWKEFTAVHPQRLPAKYIRGSAANLITGNNQFSLQLKFLANVPTGVAHKFYVDPPQKDLDRAVMQLRKSLKLVPANA